MKIVASVMIPLTKALDAGANDEDEVDDGVIRPDRRIWEDQVEKSFFLLLGLLFLLEQVDRRTADFLSIIGNGDSQ